MPKNLFFLLMAFLPLTAFSPANKNIGLGSAVNMAAKQRMLTQRMGKAYLYKTLGINLEQSTREIEASVTTFEENLRLLKAFSPSEEITHNISLMDTQWFIYKKIVTGEITRPHAQYVVENNSNILAACELTVNSIVAYAQTQNGASELPNMSAKEIAPLIATAGKQRMLCQRLALYFAAQKLGIKEGDVTANLKAAMTEFQQNLSMLFVAPANNTEVDDALSEVLTQWNKLRDHAGEIERGEFSATELFTLTNQILTSMDKVTSVYDRLLK